MVINAKQVCCLLSFCVFAHICGLKVYAAYVLPYPSYMPGNKLYKVSRIIDAIEKYWYWGSLATLKYHLKLSDKYLIEAKTLFEYKQYLLGVDALGRSDTAFGQIPETIRRGDAQGEDISHTISLAADASKEHIRILERLVGEVPEKFSWQPEKAQPTLLSLEDILQRSIVVRKTTVEKIKFYEKRNRSR